MARSPIQPKKQGNRKSSEDGRLEATGKEREGGWTKFEKRKAGNIGGAIFIK